MITKRVSIAVFLLASACGDNSKQCGPNTTDQEGVCVPTVTCGTGTVADENGNCVPDGSVVCADGTMFDVASGTCVPSMDACGDGTVLIDGVCRDPGTVTPNATEAPEVNDNTATGAGSISLPAIGAPGYVIHGCITPRDNGATPDFDPWFITVSQPVVLEIAADGLGGLAAGFAVFNSDGNPALDDYVRFGLNTLTDSAKRQLYLPVAGEYVVFLADQRTLLGLGAAGNAASCYYATIKQVALPTPVALTLPTTTGSDSGNVQVYRYTSTADGTVFKATLTERVSVVDPAFVAVRNATFHGLATDQGGFAPGPTRYVGAVNNAQSVDVIVDMEFNSSIAPQPFQIDSYTIGASALPTGGGSVNVTTINDTNPRDPIADGGIALIRNQNLYYFDVAADSDVVEFDVSANDQTLMLVWRTDLVDNATGNYDVLAGVNEPGNLDFTDQFIRFLRPGRYYVGLFQLGGSAGTMYSLTSTLNGQNAPAVMEGSTLTGAAISDVTGSGWREFDPGASKWVEMTGAGANLGGGGDLEVLYYPGTVEGWLDNGTGPLPGDIPTVPAFDQTFAADGSTGALGRITLNFPLAPFLVRFRSSAGPAVGQTFDYAIAKRMFADLMTTTEAAPAMMSNIPVPANSRVRFLVQSVGRTTIETVGATFDAQINWLRFDELTIFPLDLVGGVGDETFPDIPAFLGYVAFEVENLDGTNGTTGVRASTMTAAPFVDICSSTTEIISGDNVVAAPQPLGFTFSLFGSNVTQFRASTNGWLTFIIGPVGSVPFPPAGMPDNAAPNGVIAGFWDDLQANVCVRNDPTRTIVQWTGFSWNTFEDVQFQVSIYNTNNRIEWAFGPDHADDGGNALGGVESLNGNVGIEVFNTLPLIGPGYGDAVELP